MATRTWLMLFSKLTKAAAKKLAIFFYWATTTPSRSSFGRSPDKNVESGDALSQEKLLKSESDLYGIGVFDWASVAPVSATTDDEGQQIVVIRLHESRRNTVDIGGGLEIIPETATFPVGSVVVPGLPPVSLGNKFSVSQKSFIGPRGSLPIHAPQYSGKS